MANTSNPAITNATAGDPAGLVGLTSIQQDTLVRGGATQGGDDVQMLERGVAGGQGGNDTNEGAGIFEGRPGGRWQGGPVSNAPPVRIPSYMQPTVASTGGNPTQDRSHERHGPPGAPRRAHRARASHPEPPNRVLGSAGSPFEGDGLTVDARPLLRGRLTLQEISASPADTPLPTTGQRRTTIGRVERDEHVDEQRSCRVQANHVITTDLKGKQ
jgi:hypothetical protein